MSLTSDIKALADSLTKSRNIRSVEINSTMSPDIVARLLREISDHARAQGKTKSVSVVSFVH